MEYEGAAPLVPIHVPELLFEDHRSAQLDIRQVPNQLRQCACGEKDLGRLAIWLMDDAMLVA